MRLIISFTALFLSVSLLQLSSGGVGPLDALTGLSLGFTTPEIGLLGSAHFVGFFLGCWWTPRLMGSVGHSRAFATCTALGAVGLLGHTLTEHLYAWTVLRVFSGLCVAGCYTVIESWLQAKVTNETRGRAMGLYRSVDISASLGAQLMIGALASVETYVAYNTLTLLCCASLLPLALTRASPPKTDHAPRLRPALAWQKSPLAVAGVVVAALSGASFRMVGPVYGQEVGLTPGQIGTFLAVFVAGGALAQYPAGWLADRYDRRNVLIAFSFGAILSCGLSMGAPSLGFNTILTAAFLFGFMSFPIYSVAAAHAHDFATSDERVELSAALIFVFAAGAITAPLSTSALIERFGPNGFFYFIAFAHGVLILFGVLRMRVRRTAEKRTPYVYAPRTSFMIGRLLRKQRDRR
ncbi:MAG: MFS transporter [Pseudomonadota bacterium]